MSIIRNRLYQFKQELLSNKDRAWYSHTNLLTAVDLLITDLDNLDESDWIRVNDEMPVERDSMFAKFKGTNKWKTGMFEKVSRNVLVTVEYDNGERHTEVAYDILWSYNADDRYHHNIHRLLGYTRSFRQNRL